MNTFNKLPEVIGLSGTFAAGKDALAEWLAENRAYQHVSTGDMVREAALERYGDIERPTLVRVGQELRQESGPGVLAVRALDKGRPLAISGIRTAGEVEAIKSAGGVMVFVDADPRVRYERMQARARDKEAKLSYEDFMAREQRELEIKADTSEQNIGIVKSLSDLTLDNSGDFTALIDQALSKLEQHSTDSATAE